MTSETIALGQIGDGVVALRTTEGVVVGPLRPQRGEYANESVFLTGGDQLPEIVLATNLAPAITGLSLSSDGLRLLITDDVVAGTPYEPFFTDLFSAAEQGLRDAELATFLAAIEDRTGDDKSLLVAVRRP